MNYPAIPIGGSILAGVPYGLNDLFNCKSLSNYPLQLVLAGSLSGHWWEA